MPEKATENELYVGGRLLAEITNRIVSMVREHYGRGPVRAKTYLNDDLIVCVMSDGFTPLEKTTMESSAQGQGEEKVLEMRRGFQTLMKERYVDMIEEITGRRVLAFLSQAHVEPDLTVEMFRVDGPLRGFGVLEVLNESRYERPSGLVPDKYKEDRD